MDIRLRDRAEGGPHYLQIRQHVETLIRERQLAPGDTLPSPASLANKLAIDKGEVQRAYFELEHSGLVTRKTAKDFLGKEKTTYTVK
jgi:DNA-binding transcriptional regulator YhcF (GntR family)